MLNQLKNNISNKLLRYNYAKAKRAFEKAIPF